MAELPKAPQRGDDILAAFNRLRDFVRRERLLSVVGGRLSQTDGGKTLSIHAGGGSMAFSGTAYIAGNKTTGLGTKAWVRCKLDLATAEDNDGPPPDPFPPNEEWYEVAQTPGDIHISRA
jgi:hypothetical protein